jgi:aspartate racemase
MAKHIGIVGCSAEGAALCYRTICSEAPKVMGEHRHPEITMHTHPLADYMVAIRKGDWENVAAIMLSSANKLAGAGANFAVCPDNTIHQAFELVRERSPIPWLHIAEAVAEEARKRNFQHLAVLGTEYLMTGPVYPRVLDRFGISSEIPDASVREKIDEIIFKELVNGIFSEASRIFFDQVMDTMKQRGCDAAVLGCTEIPLIVDPEGAPLPTLDSTRLLARAALQKAMAA